MSIEERNTGRWMKDHEQPQKRTLYHDKKHANSIITCHSSSFLLFLSFNLRSSVFALSQHTFILAWYFIRQRRALTVFFIVILFFFLKLTINFSQDVHANHSISCSIRNHLTFSFSSFSTYIVVERLSILQFMLIDIKYQASSQRARGSKTSRIPKKCWCFEHERSIKKSSNLVRLTRPLTIEIKGGKWKSLIIIIWLTHSLRLKLYETLYSECKT